MIEGTLAVGDTVSVRGGLPRSYGRPLGLVHRINATTVTVALYYDRARGDDTTRRIPHESCRLVRRHDSRPWAIIPCAARKIDRPAPIASLYLGSFHAQCAATALALTGADRVVILSGRYGLVRLVDPTVREPYEQRIDAPGAIGRSQLRDQALRIGLTGPAERVVILAGKAYTAAVQAALPDRHLEVPLAGGRGIGHHKATLAKIASTGLLPAPN